MFLNEHRPKQLSDQLRSEIFPANFEDTHEKGTLLSLSLLRRWIFHSFANELPVAIDGRKRAKWKKRERVNGLRGRFPSFIL